MATLLIESASASTAPGKLVSFRSSITFSSRRSSHISWFVPGICSQYKFSSRSSVWPMDLWTKVWHQKAFYLPHQGYQSKMLHLEWPELLKDIWENTIRNKNLKCDFLTSTMIISLVVIKPWGLAATFCKKKINPIWFEVSWCFIHMSMKTWVQDNFESNYIKYYLPEIKMAI